MQNQTLKQAKPNAWGAGIPDTDYTGKVFNHITVLGVSAVRKYGRMSWQCQCVCGNEITLLTEEVRTERPFSCGCTKRPRSYKSHAHLYKRWDSMRQRVKPTSRHRRHYHGKGITICERWQSYDNFKADMGDSFRPELSLDRIDNAKGYSPDNCRWVSMKVQSNNKDTCVYMTLHGKTLTLTQWAEFAGIGTTTLRRRLCSGAWTLEEALTTLPYVGFTFRAEFIEWLNLQTATDVWTVVSMAVTIKRGRESKVLRLDAYQIPDVLQAQVLSAALPK